MKMTQNIQQATCNVTMCNQEYITNHFRIFKNSYIYIYMQTTLKYRNKLLDEFILVINHDDISCS